MITTIILAKNEERHIERAVASCLPLGTVFVVDSGSSDHTEAKAAAAGAHVLRRPWLGFAAQRNWAIDNVTQETDWFLFLDADEYFEPHDIQLLAAATKSSAHRIAALSLQRRNYFAGSPLPHAGRWPDRQTRVFRKGRVRYEQRSIHEWPVVDGEVLKTDVTLQHDGHNSAEDLLLKHLSYARLEAKEYLMLDQDAALASVPRLGSRRWLKSRVWARLPCRPMIRWAWLTFVRQGWRDGTAGRAYISILVAYEAMIDALMAESETLAPGNTMAHARSLVQNAE